MPLMLLQIDFVDARPTAEDKTAALTQLAHNIAQTLGLVWKIWTENPDTREAGGSICLRMRLLLMLTLPCIPSG
jgi:hypothetical protein